MSELSIAEIDEAIDTLVKVLNSLNPGERAEKAKRLYDVIGDLGGLYNREKMSQQFYERLIRWLEEFRST